MCFSTHHDERSQRYLFYCRLVPSHVALKILISSIDAADPTQDRLKGSYEELGWSTRVVAGIVCVSLGIGLSVGLLCGGVTACVVIIFCGRQGHDFERLFSPPGVSFHDHVWQCINFRKWYRPLGGRLVLLVAHRKP